MFEENEIKNLKLRVERKTCPKCNEPMFLERYIPDGITVWWCSKCSIGIPFSWKEIK
jgi:hypothetical protein